MEPKQLLTPSQVAQLLNCRPSSVYAWAKTGRIPAYKINGLLRFEQNEIQAWIEESKIKPETEKKHVSKLLTRPVTDVEAIVRRAIDSVKGTGYTNGRRNRTIKGRKEAR